MSGCVGVEPAHQRTPAWREEASAAGPVSRTHSYVSRRQALQVLMVFDVSGIQTGTLACPQTGGKRPPISAFDRSSDWWKSLSSKSSVSALGVPGGVAWMPPTCLQGCWDRPPCPQEGCPPAGVRRTETQSFQSVLWISSTFCVRWFQSEETGLQLDGRPNVFRFS